MKTNQKHLKHKLTTLAIAAAILATAARAKAESFGVNFLGNTTADLVTGTAGVVPISGWNNINNGTFTSGTVTSSDSLFSATLTLSGAGKGNGWNNGTTADGGNGSLMRGYNDAGINNPSTSTLSGLTGSAYTLYVYCQGDATRPGNGGDWLPNYTINGTTYYTATLGGSFSSFVEGGITFANNNTYPPSLTYGNYLKIENVSPIAGTITISANADNQTWRSPFNGFELVVVPEPSSAALIFGWLAVLGLVRRR